VTATQTLSLPSYVNIAFEGAIWQQHAEAIFSLGTVAFRDAL
jgi:hypothetical protein